MNTFATRSLRGALLVLALSGCTWTRPFTDGQGRVVAGSVATMEMIELGGVRQSVWYRGRDVKAPALILLHGGPGASASALFRQYDAELEDRYLVVYWEQRGTGRSYHAGMPHRCSLEALRPQYSSVDLTRFRCFEVPVIFMLGRHDWHVPAVLAAEYFERIDAPVKRLVWFEDSAHDPSFEEPDAFVRAMLTQVRPIAIGAGGTATMDCRGAHAGDRELSTLGGAE